MREVRDRGGVATNVRLLDVPWGSWHAERSVKSGICPTETPLRARGFANVVSKAARQLGKRRLGHTEVRLYVARREGFATMPLGGRADADD